MTHKKWLDPWPSAKITYRSLRGLLRKAPRDPRLHALLGRSHAALGEYERAYRAWQEAIHLWGRGYPGAVASLREQMGQTLLQLGRDTQARQQFRWAARAYRSARTSSTAPAVVADLKARETACLRAWRARGRRSRGAR